MKKYFLFQNSAFDGFKGFVKAENTEEALNEVAYRLTLKGYQDVKVDVERCSVFFTAWFSPSEKDDSKKALYNSNTFYGQVWGTNYISATVEDDWEFTDL